MHWRLEERGMMDFWERVFADNNVDLGAALWLAGLAVLANLNWRFTVRFYAGAKPYPSPSKVRFWRAFLLMLLPITAWAAIVEIQNAFAGQVDIAASIVFAAFLLAITTAFFGIAGFFSRLKPLTDEEINRKLPAEYAVKLVDNVIYNARTDGEVEALPLDNLVKVSIEKRASRRKYHRVWFLLEGRQGHRVFFPEGAEGKDAIVNRLRQLPGFVLPDLATWSQSHFQCWAAPNN